MVQCDKVNGQKILEKKISRWDYKLKNLTTAVTSNTKV